MMHPLRRFTGRGSATRVALFAGLFTSTLITAASTHAAAPHLANPDAIKTAIACQKLVQKEGARLVSLRRLRLTTCAKAVLACTAKDQKCREKAAASKNPLVAQAKCEPARLTCAQKAHDTCRATMDQLENGATFMDVVIRADKCRALDFADLTGAAGLGFGALAATCQRQFGLGVTTIEPLSQCIVRQYACQADKLIEAEIPRVHELLRTAGVPADVIAARAPCLEDHAGKGESLPVVARTKAAASCEAHFRQEGKTFSATALKDADTCLNEILKCVQTKPDDSDCLDGARKKCHKAVARMAAKGDALEAALVKKDECAAAYPDLAAPAGGNRQGISCACELAGVKPVANLGDAAYCLRRTHECRAAKLLPFAAPRAEELLGLVGLTPAALLCSFDGAVPTGALPGLTLGRALSRRAHPTLPTIRNLLTGAGTSSGKKGASYDGTKIGTGTNGPQTVAARRRVLPDSSARFVARYAKRRGVSLTVIGILRDNTGDGLLLDGYYDVPEDGVTDETDTTQTNLVLTYPPDVTTCAYELGVMVDDPTELSEPVLFEQKAVVDPEPKLLALKQVEEEDVTDSSGNAVRGLEGDRWIVMSPDAEFVYVAGASNTVGFCRKPPDPTRWFCKQDSDCGPTGGPCRLNKPRGTSDALVSFRRLADGELKFTQTISFGPESADPALRLRVDANPLGIAVSPNNAQVYVVLGRSEAVLVFTRDVNDNLVLTQKLVRATTPGEAGNPVVVGDIREPRAVLVSPDGKHVYVASRDIDALVVFARNAQTGALTYVQTKRNGTGDVPAGTLGAANALAFDQPAGATLYVAATGDHAVAAFQRNTSTGALTFVEAEHEGVNGVSGLTSIRDVTVSPDGKFVYTAGFTPALVGALATFARDAATGALTFVEETTDGAVGPDAAHPLEDFTPTRASVSPDGAYLFAAGGVGDIPDNVDGPDATIASFARDPVTGKLSYLYDAGGNGLGGGVCLVVSPDSKTLYSTTQRTASVGFYTIQPPEP